ncbi:Transmembrane domain-containing protein [Spironucleus salmonicida]|uniref:Transmembrane domain-containing protein n=1 Tax=Spironucleus salmonicida TaxID=348837 RepID=A0A9P8LL22_9EUKA|nr:Transmembrane domain-containing protein [Spironucleus salmonicida]
MNIIYYSKNSFNQTPQLIYNQYLRFIMHSLNINYTENINSELQLSYVILAAISCIVNAIISLLTLCGAIKNKFNIWSPHFEFFVFISGNILTTVSFIIRWEASITTSESPLYYLGQSMTISSVIVLNNKLQFMMQSSAKQHNPFWVCVNIVHTKKTYLLQLFYALLPQVCIIVVQFITSFLISNHQILMYFNFSIDVLFSIIILYYAVIVGISASQYLTINKDQSTFARLSLIVSFLSVIDSVISQILYFLSSTFQNFDLNVNINAWAIIVFIKDWESLIIIVLEQIFVFLMLKYIYIAMKELKQAMELDYLLDSYE